MRLRMVSPASTSLRPTKLAVRNPSMVSMTSAMTRPVPVSYTHLDVYKRQLVDWTHHRHEVEDGLARLHQLAADEARSEESEHGQHDQCNDQTGAGNFHRQIGFRLVGDRDERPHQGVHPVDEPPGQADRDVERSDQDQPGQEVIAQARDQAVMERHRLVGLRRSIARRQCRNRRRISVKFTHATALASMEASKAPRFERRTTRFVS